LPNTGPGLQALEEGKPLIIDRDDKRLRIALADGAQHLVGDDMRGVGQTDDPAQHLAAAPDPAIHAVIEHRVVDTGRQLVAALRIPVAFAVDRLGFADRHGADVGRGRIRLHVSAIVRDSDAVIRRPARVGRMIGVTALVGEQAPQRLVVGRSCHCILHK
jgi:hypothetical protein